MISAYSVLHARKITLASSLLTGLPSGLMPAIHLSAFVQASSSSLPIRLPTFPQNSALYTGHSTKCICDSLHWHPAVAHSLGVSWRQILRSNFPRGRPLDPAVCFALQASSQAGVALARGCAHQRTAHQSCLDPSDHLDEVVTGMSQPKDGVSSQDRETAHTPGATRLAP